MKAIRGNNFFPQETHRAGYFRSIVEEGRLALTRTHTCWELVTWVVVIGGNSG